MAKPDHKKTTPEQRKQIEDLRQVMATENGRAFIWRLLDLTGVFRTSFTGNSQTFFNEGQRNIGLIFMADLHEFCLDSFMQMMQEAKQQQVIEQQIEDSKHDDQQ